MFGFLWIRASGDFYDLVGVLRTADTVDSNSQGSHEWPLVYGVCCTVIRVSGFGIGITPKEGCDSGGPPLFMAILMMPCGSTTVAVEGHVLERMSCWGTVDRRGLQLSLIRGRSSKSDSLLLEFLPGGDPRVLR